MAVVLGTNSGFVTVAPTADPAGVNVPCDDASHATRHTSDASAARITEIGWWCDTASEEANFEVGVYTDDGGADPNAQVHVSATNAKGTDAGWKVVTGLDWAIDPSTLYWLCLQVDNVTTATNTNNAASGGAGSAFKSTQSALPSPWGSSTLTDADGMVAIYAVWDEGEESELAPEEPYLLPARPVLPPTVVTVFQ